jgi:hypothetical protein
MWLLPDGTRIAELSTKCPPGDAFKIGLKTRSYLEGLGLDLDADSQTKTKSALAFFASQLAPKAEKAEKEEAAPAG